MPPKQSKAMKKAPVKRSRDDNALQDEADASRDVRPAPGNDEGDTTLAANASLAVVEDDDLPMTPSVPCEWNKKIHDALVSEAKSMYAARNYVCAVPCFLAAQRLRRVVLNDESAKTIDECCNDWSSICQALMSLPSTSVEASEVRRLLISQEVMMLGVGWLELFSVSDLCYIMLGHDDMGTDEASHRIELHEACKASKPSLAQTVILSRFSAIGFVRFKQWLWCLKRDPTLPMPPPDSQEYENLPEEEQESLTSITDFLMSWQAMLGTEAKSLYEIVHARQSFRYVEVLMSDDTIGELNHRTVGHDQRQALISTLDSLLVEKAPARSRTLVLSGESGSGKTMSFLALATLEKEFICVYMTAKQLVGALKSRCTVDLECKELMTDTALRDRTVAEGIVRVLLSMADRELKEERLPVHSAQRVLICVDEAGEYPNVVRAMCATPGLTIPADLLPAADAGRKVTLREYLNVNDIQLIVSGTGVNADKVGIGSALEKYYHVVVDSKRVEKVLATLDGDLRAYLPCLEAYRKARLEGAVCSVLRRLDAVKTNARMFAAFVGEVLDSNVFCTLREETRHLTESVSELHLSRWLLVDAVCYSELKACLSRAMFQFKSANALSKCSFQVALRAVFVSLSYCCLPENYCGDPAPLVYESRLGILVDQAEGVDPSRGGTLPTEPGNSYRLVSEQVWLREDFVHRYSVSAAHSEFALSSLGIREPVWTRLGFERAVMDMCYLHTCMALCSKLRALTLIGDEATISPHEDLPAHATPVETKCTTLFNESRMDPLRWLKAELWTEAQKLKDVGWSKGVPVFILTTTLAKPTASEERSWPSEGGSEKKRVMPDHWLAAAIRQRVDEHVKQGAFSSNKVPQVRLIVIAMMYQDAPGVDGVIAYGTCCKDRIGTKDSFVMATLMKLQMKYHVTNSECISSSHGVLQEEGQVQCRDTSDCNHRRCLDAVELDYLSRMGHGASKASAVTAVDAAASATEIRHRLVIYDETQGPRAHLYRASINSNTLAEALHPTKWDGTHQTMNEYDEVATHAIGLQEEMLK